MKNGTTATKPARLPLTLVKRGHPARKRSTTLRQVRDLAYQATTLKEVRAALDEAVAWELEKEQRSS